MSDLIKVTDIQSRNFTLKFNTVEEYITEGRKVVKSLHCHQALMAYYALSACEIRNGGKSPNNYTLRQYAIDVGLNEKTLRQWTLVYRRVIQHLGIPLDKITTKTGAVTPIKIRKIRVVYEASNIEDKYTTAKIRVYNDRFTSQNLS